MHVLGRQRRLHSGIPRFAGPAVAVIDRQARIRQRSHDACRHEPCHLGQVTKRHLQVAKQVVGDRRRQHGTADTVRFAGQIFGGLTEPERRLALCLTQKDQVVHRLHSCALLCLGWLVVVVVMCRNRRIG